MTKLCLLLLPLISLIISDAYSQQYGKRDAIIRQCEGQYGGEVKFGQQITKTINGVKHVCYSDVKCVEESEGGYIRILQPLKDACVSKATLDKERENLNRRLFLGQPNCLTGVNGNGNGGLNCGNGNVDIGGGLVVGGTSIPAQCSREYRKFLKARDKYFSKGKGGGFLIFVKSRQKRYQKWKKKLQKCLFSYGGASCLEASFVKKKASCFNGVAGISIGPGNQVIFNGGTGSTDCSVGGRCLSNAEIELLLADYYEEDCDECDARKERRRNKRNRRGGGGGNAAGIISSILNPLAYFGSNYFGAKFSADAVSAGAEACATAYNSYTGSIDTINNNIATENANVRSPGGLPLIGYTDPRTPRCNGHNLGAFAGIGGFGFGGNTFQNGLGYNPLFPQSYLGFNQGVSGFNPYGGLGGMVGLNIGIGGQLPGGQFGFGSPWQQGGFYRPGGAGWMAGANGHLPYGGAFGGIGGGNPWGAGGAFGAGGFGGFGGGGAWGQPGWGGNGWGNGAWGAGFGVSQRNFQNPQGALQQTQLQQQARMRDAQYYGNRAFGASSFGFGGAGFNGMPFYNTPYATPPFAPFR